jgi:hypothetical protein
MSSHAKAALRLTATDLTALDRARLEQRRRERALSADEVLATLRNLHRFGEWAGMDTSSPR